MIGIFDSGVGGMTVARAIEKTLPEKSILYFGDLARTPYGSKSPETIIEYSRQNVRFLLDNGAKLIIIACNSAASVASDILRQEFNVPIFEVITPAVEKAVATTTSGRIGVIGTRATVKSGVYARLIHQTQSGHQVLSQACPLLVPLVEEGWLFRRETKMIVRSYLQPLKNKKIDTLVLGCTHYPLLREIISQRMGKAVQVIDSSHEVADKLCRYLGDNPEFDLRLTGSGRSRFFASDVTPAALKIAESIFGRPIELMKVK